MSDLAAYIDTSCLLKLLFLEPESASAARKVNAESQVMVSSLTRVEAEQQIVARWLGGHLTARKQRQVQTGLARLLDQTPFQFMGLGSALWDLARVQMSQTSVHCRTLDRLHLAAMGELGVHRLITHDQRQAAAAMDLGFDVIRL